MKTKAHTIYKLASGKRVSGVTTVLGAQLGWNKNALIAWARKTALAGNDPDKVRDKAADIGTITHHLIECRIKGVEPELTEYAQDDIRAAKIGYEGYLEWEQENEPEYCMSEVPLVHEPLRYGGTLDLIARIRSRITLVDFKTSSGIYPEHYCQMSAYKELYEENVNRGEIEAATLLHIDKVFGIVTQHKVSKRKLEWGMEVFKSCLRLHELQRQLKARP